VGGDGAGIEFGPGLKQVCIRSEEGGASTRFATAGRFRPWHGPQGRATLPCWTVKGPEVGEAPGFRRCDRRPELNAAEQP